MARIFYAILTRVWQWREIYLTYTPVRFHERILWGNAHPCLTSRNLFFFFIQWINRLKKQIAPQKKKQTDEYSGVARKFTSIPSSQYTAIKRVDVEE
jgi:hypothetical protein